MSSDVLSRLDFPERKQLRSLLIRDHLRRTDQRRVVCFSCGNASRCLGELLQPQSFWFDHQQTRYTVVAITPDGPLQTNKWWTPTEIAEVWPDFCDATPGHLSVPMMHKLATMYKAKLASKLNGAIGYIVPTGSGETIIALGMAFPGVKFIAEYNDNTPGTTYDAANPNNVLVARMFETNHIRKEPAK